MTVLPARLLRKPAALSPLTRSAARVEPPVRTLSTVLPLLVRIANVSDVVLGVRGVGVFAVVVGRFVTLDSNVRSPVIEVRSSESRLNRFRSDVRI